MRLVGTCLAACLLALAAAAAEEEPPLFSKVAEWTLPNARRIRFGPKGLHVLAEIDQGRFQVRSTADGSLVLDRAGLRTGADAPVFDRTGRLLAFCTPAGAEAITLTTIRLDGGEPKETEVRLPFRVTEHNVPTVCGISSDGRFVAVAGVGPLLRNGRTIENLSVFDLPAKRLVTYVEHLWGRGAVTMGDGVAIYQTGPPPRQSKGEYRLKVLDLAKERVTLDLAAVRPPLVLTPDGRTLIRCETEGSVTAWNLSTGKRGLLLEGDRWHSLTLSADGRRLGARSGETKASFYDLEKRERYDLDLVTERRRLIGLRADGRLAYLATSYDVLAYDLVEKRWRGPAFRASGSFDRMDPTGKYLLAVRRSGDLRKLTLYRAR